MKKYERETDDVLVEKTLLGDSAAYSELVIRHERAVMGTAVKITGNEFSAEDAAQDAFLAAWMKLDSLRDRSRFSSFVCAIAKNCARDLRRRYSCAAPEISLSLLEYEDLDRETKFAAEEREAIKRLKEEVDALDAETRKIVKAHYFDGMKVSEIAVAFGIPAGTVKWRLSEGRKLLRKGYGIVEKEYDENETLVRRVMRQVEELKLWKLKNRKTGFEEEYRAVLAAVEALDNTEEKHHALADVLLLGYWWMPGQKNAEVLEKLKTEAEKGRNEDAMALIMEQTVKGNGQRDEIDCMINEQIPYLRKIGFPRTEAYVWFWAGRRYVNLGEKENAEICFKNAKSLLPPISAYYAASVAALTTLPKIANDGIENYVVVAELLKRIDGAYYLWEQPGFGEGDGSAIFYYSSICDRLLFSDKLKVGETITSSDGVSIFSLVANDVTVDTPAGRFADCLRFRTARLDVEVETDWAPGVGIVRQKINEHWADSMKYETLLCSYTIKGGDGYLPFEIGNRWEYKRAKTAGGFSTDKENDTVEVVGKNSDTVSIAHCYYNRDPFDFETWAGNMYYASMNYCNTSDDSLCDVLPYIEKAKTLAVWPRERIHSDIAYDVMKRILSTDPKTNPDFTEYGLWNFFDSYNIERRGTSLFLQNNWIWLSFEWKETKGLGDAGYPVLHNFLYDILSDANNGCLWDERWKPGFSEKKEFFYQGMTSCTSKIEIAPDTERVETSAGIFEDCLKLTFDLRGVPAGLEYRGWTKSYWYAPGVGIVMMREPYGPEGRLINLWSLTEYRGEGGGYFPCADGFFRKYEAQGLTNGFHASVEYTYLEDEKGLTIFKNALGTQDRENYLKNSI